MRITNQLRNAAARLEAAGIGSPRPEAEQLAAHVLGVPRGRLILVDAMDDSQRSLFDELIERRAGGEPLQHLIGTAPFLSLELQVGPGVFIPRPETELLARWGMATNPTIAVDLCAGSGALALAIAHAHPDAQVYAVERSDQALEWLRRNVKGTSVEVIAGDIREVELPTGVDLVLSNPPYVPEHVQVPADVRSDPPDAVFAGIQGLDLIPVVIKRAAEILRAGGRFGFEHDDTHTSLRGLLEKDFTDIELHRDLAGRPRFTTATRRA